MNDDTSVIDMRTPATAPIPVVPVPWDELVRPARRRRRMRRKDWALVVETGFQVGGLLALAYWLLAKLVFWPDFVANWTPSVGP